MNNQFVKYTFVCDPDACDALLEFTARDGFDFPSGVVQITCPCGRQMQYISCTIEEVTKKEGTMENVIATPEFLQAQIATKDASIQALEQRVTYLNDRNIQMVNEVNRIKDQMKEWTLEALQCNDINENHAEEIAMIVGFELETEVEVEVSVTYYITVNVPVGEDAEDIIGEIDFDAVTYDSDKITHVSSSVDNISI